MEWVQLRSFVVLAEVRNFRRSAERLHLSQPSLSQQVRRMERELGVQLVDRGQRPVVLTDAGRVLAARAEHLLATLDDLVAEVRDAAGGAGGSLAVGALQYLVHLELSDVLAVFRGLHPSTELLLRVGNTGEVRGMLLDDEVDLGLLHAESEPLPTRIASIPLRSEELVVLLAPEDERADAGHVEWTDLADDPFVVFRRGASLRDALDAAARRAGFHPRTPLESSDIAAAITLVERGLGAALVPRSLARTVADRVGVVTVGDRSVRRTLVLAWDAERYRSQTSQAFGAMAREAFGSAGPAPDTPVAGPGPSLRP